MAIELVILAARPLLVSNVVQHGYQAARSSYYTSRSDIFRFAPYSAGRAGAAIDLAAAVWDKDLTSPIREVSIVTKVYRLGGLTRGRFGHANQGISERAASGIKDMGNTHRNILEGARYQVLSGRSGERPEEEEEIGRQTGGRTDGLA